MLTPDEAEGGGEGMAGSVSKMYFCQHSSFTTSSSGQVPN